MANSLLTLNKRSDFLSLKDEGRSKKVCPWLMISYKKNQNQGLRVGWTILKKNTQAVSRNKMKRWCREFFRSLDSDTINVDINVILRAQEKDFFKDLEYSKFQQKLARAWKFCQTSS